MAVPKRKTSKSKRNMRRSHHALKTINISYDHKGNPTLPHNVSAEGNYNNREVIKRPETTGQELSS